MGFQLQELQQAPDQIPHMVDEEESDRSIRRMLSRPRAGRQTAYKTRRQLRLTKMQAMPL